MFNVLDSALFSLLNEYARNPFLDSVLPFFSLSWPLWLGAFVFFSFFIFYCRKHYGDALWRLLVLGIVLGISVGVSELGASLMKDAFGRYRPYQALSGTMYYDTRDDAWVQIQILPTMSSDDLNSIEDVEIVEDGKLDVALQDILPNDAELTANIESNTVTSESVSDESIFDESISDESISDESISDESVSDESVSDESVSDESVSFNVDALLDTESDLISANNSTEMQDVLPETQDNLVETQGDSASYKIVGYSQVQLQTMFEADNSSMPSAFAATTMAMAIVIALLFHKTSPWIYMMPFLAGWSRVYTGNSYPMDILIGWIWGILAVALAWLICDMMFRFVSKNRKL